MARDLESRRFLASASAPTTKQMMTYTYLFIGAVIASLGVLYMTLFMVGAIVGSAKWQWTDRAMSTSAPPPVRVVIC